jgi:uncharacterized protein (TIGR04222 family)
MCQELLGKPLHHEPSRGGAAEIGKHRQMYADTLEAYRQTFGAQAPPDIWPDVDIRFAHERSKSQSRLIRWLTRFRFKRPGRPRQSQPARAMAVLPLAGMPLVDFTSPFDLRGPDFLKLYFCVALVAFVLGLVIRRLARRDANDAFDESQPLDRYELAYFCGGAGRAINVAVAQSLRKGWLKSVSRNPPRTPRAAASPNSGHVFEKQIAADFPLALADRSLRDIHRTAKPHLRPIHEKLQQRGLLLSDSAWWTGQVLPLLLMASVIAFGVIKIAIGVERHRPVVFLAMGSIAVTIVSLIAFARPLFRTRRGKDYLDKLNHQYDALHQAAQRAPDALPDDQLALALGLWGCGLMMASPYRELHREGWIGGYSGGCGTVSGGGCGGGGGGCGGGGCGGGGCGGGGGGGCGGG